MDNTQRLYTAEMEEKGRWWWQDPGLRKLYLLMCIAVLSSTTNGYDG